MSQFKPKPYRDKKRREEREQKRVDKAKRESQKFEKNINRKVQVVVYYWFVEPKFVRNFWVNLQDELPIKEILKRMDRGFGDLEEREVKA